jgi:hypothetical protein
MGNPFPLPISAAGASIKPGSLRFIQIDAAGTYTFTPSYNGPHYVYGQGGGGGLVGHVLNFPNVEIKRIKSAPQLLRF